MAKKRIKHLSANCPDTYIVGMSHMIAVDKPLIERSYPSKLDD
jgi:hypothetical protein